MKNIVWLASYPKSGNTWMRIFLTAYMLDVRVSINKIFGRPSTGSRDLFEKFAEVDSRKLTDDEIDNIRPDMFRKFSDSETRDKPIFVKMHDCLHKNKNDEYIIPFDRTKAIIHMIRNPLDVAVSYGKILQINTISFYGDNISSFIAIDDGCLLIFSSYAQRLRYRGCFIIDAFMDKNGIAT